jgi:hypothetical protein
MAAIDRARIPDAALLSPEALACWIVSMMDEMYAAAPLVRETIGLTSSAITVGEFRDLDRTPRLSFRCNIPLKADYKASVLPIWATVEQIENVTLPVAYLKP